MSQHADAIRWAHANGYHVTPGGELVSSTGRIRKPYIHPRKRYALYSIRVDGRPAHIYAHKLAAYQWFGEPALARGVHVRHLDGNPLNNSQANLALGSARQNSLDRAEHARRTQALKAAKARRALTDDQVRELVTLSRQGWRGSALAAHFGVRKSTVSEILSGKLYSETTGIAPCARSSSGHRPAGAASSSAARGAGLMREFMPRQPVWLRIAVWIACNYIGALAGVGAATLLRGCC